MRTLGILVRIGGAALLLAPLALPTLQALGVTCRFPAQRHYPDY